MIGWKAKYGYIEYGYQGGVEDIVNINQFTFTDEGPFTILTNKFVLPDGFVFARTSDNISTSATPKQKFETEGNLAIGLEKLLGDDYYGMYIRPSEFDSRYNVPDTHYAPVTNSVASAQLACPNLYQFFINQGKENGYKYRAVIYIPSLKKLIGPSANIYNVLEGGTLQVLFNKSVNAQPPNGLRTNSSSFWWGGYLVAPDFDGTKESFYNQEFLYYLQMTFANSSHSYCINRGTNSEFSKLVSFYKALFNDYTKPDIDIPDNPYEPGGPSGPTDPDLPPGTFDDESDPIPDSPLPTLSAANTGFTRIYNPSLSQVQALARYLWTDPDVIQTIWNHIKQFFENPMEAIIGFNLVPVPVPDGGTENFALMYINTGVSMTVAANQFVDLDCGTVELKRYYGSALDQSPYTKVSCFLPYIGTVNLNTDEVMGTTLQVKYRVDIVSGSCVAKIFVDGNCLYQYSGHCAITIPISSADFSSYVSAAISVGKLAAAAITAGAGAAMAAGVAEVSQQTNQVVTTTQVTNTSRNPSTGRQITTGTTTTVQTRESPANQSSTQASFSGLSPQNVANTVGAIMSSKPHIEHSGSFSGNSGYLGVRRPFLIIERPNMCMPANYQTLNGFPAMITMELSTCKGFTRVQQVQLTGMGRATNPEQAEILELLKSGVIL